MYPAFSSECYIQIIYYSYIIINRSKSCYVMIMRALIVIEV